MITRIDWASCAHKLLYTCQSACSSCCENEFSTRKEACHLPSGTTAVKQLAALRPVARILQLLLKLGVKAVNFCLVSFRSTSCCAKRVYALQHGALEEFLVALRCFQRAKTRDLKQVILRTAPKQ